MSFLFVTTLTGWLFFALVFFSREFKTGQGSRASICHWTAAVIYGALLTAAAAGAIRGLLSTSSASIAAFRKGKDPPKKFIQSKKESPSGPPGRRPRRDFQQKSKKNRYPTIVLQKWKHFESFVIFINVLKKKNST